MSNKNDGGAAYPVPELHVGLDTKVICDNKGMTLRDYFAAAALTAIVSSLTSDEIGQIARGEVRLEGTPKAAYIFADAMLSERSKKL